MTCPRCDGPATTEALREFGGVCPSCLVEFAAEKDAPAFPGLEIERVIGEGGMGVVYQAVQKQLGRRVALKVLSPALASDPQFVERFNREARALAQLSHPNIVAVHDFGIHDGVPYLIMEYVEGTPLRKLLASGKLTPERALEVVPQICDALAYAHARGVVHRDVKPENILLDREGRVKIADFGLAKLARPGQTRITRTEMTMGTPNYMAPEQIENPSAVDHRADIYSLGVVFYEMLTGELPLGRFKPPSEKAPVDARLDPVVLRSLEKEPADRYQQAAEVKDEVTRVRSHPASPPPHRPPPGRDDRLLRKAIRSLEAAAVLGLIALVLYVMLGAWVAVWVALAAGLCAIAAASSYAQYRMSKESAPPPEPAPPGPAGGLARACGVLLVLALACLPLAFFLPAAAGRIAFTVAGALLVATLVLSVVALVAALAGRGGSRGAGLAVATLLIGTLGLGVLGFLAFFLLKAEPPPRIAPTRPVVQRGPAVMGTLRLERIWPDASELPAGLAFRAQSEGSEALKAARLPEEMMADLEEARHAVFAPGEPEVLALRFKTKALEDLWSANPALAMGERWSARTGWAPEKVAVWVGAGKLDPKSQTVQELLAGLRKRIVSPRPAPARSPGEGTDPLQDPCTIQDK